jgi:hypothetical protein
MAHQNSGRCGNVVNVIAQGVCGGGLGAVTNTPLLAQPAAIENVTADEDGDTDNQKY